MAEKRGKLSLPDAHHHLHLEHKIHQEHEHHKHNKPHSNATPIIKTIPSPNHTPHSSIESNLIANLITLQKTHLALVDKFDNLSKQISDLLALFELSAQTFTKQLDPSIAGKDSEFADKIDQILEQNKLIAKSISMLEERMRAPYPTQNQQNQTPQYNQSPGQFPRPQAQQMPQQASYQNTQRLQQRI